MNLKTVLLASCCVVALPALASAADLPLRSAPPAFVPPPPPVFTWTGFYLGVNAGYAFDNTARFTQFNTATSPTPSGIGTSRPTVVRFNDDGFTGGGQIGYNYQFGGFGFGGAGVVVGLEADAAYTDINKVGYFVGTTTAGLPALNTFSSSLDYLGTVRGRLGLAFDRFMVYGTGGFAYGEVENRVHMFVPNSTTAIRYSGGYDDVKTGYAVGGGIEYAIPTDSFLQSLNFFKSSAVTIKAEYLYYDLGSQNIADAAVTGNGGTGAYGTRIHNDGNLIRAGLNYKF